jgi:hypothetical protein
MSINGPILGNTLGHCAGVAIFTILFYLFLLDWRRSGRDRSGMSACAAALALLWNIGDLVVLAPGFQGNLVVHVLHAISFSALSLLPAVLLHIWLQPRYRRIWMTGYLLSFIAAGLHLWAHFTNSNSPHRPSQTLITAGFGGLTLISLMLDFPQPQRRWAGARLAAAMCLLLTAISFVYFDTGSAGHFHHAGIPLSLFILLIDYRFLLLDAFLRFAVRSTLACCVVFLGFVLESRFHFIERAARNQFEAALIFIGVCIVLIAFTRLSSRIETVFTRLLFRRTGVETALAELRESLIGEYTEEDFLEHARKTVERFFECQFSRLKDHLQSHDLEALPGPVVLIEKSRDPIFHATPWAEAAAPLRFSRGDALLLLLGPRRGGRRYLSDDVLLLARFAKIIEVQVERSRHLEMQALAAKAELRALQAQINPHFFFNSLNTLYGTISRDNAEARRLVLNLADVFRYFLRSDRTFITLEEELKIVLAYLEIEALRLGPKLATTIQVSEDLMKIEIPVLSIQPLVENAVKHGVAPRSSNGFVRLRVTSDNHHLKVEVVNTGGEFNSTSRNGDKVGIGLANVRRRLVLCYGFDTELHISSKDDQTVVGFSMPLARPALGHAGRGSELQRTA